MVVLYQDVEANGIRSVLGVVDCILKELISHVRYCIDKHSSFFFNGFLFYICSNLYFLAKHCNLRWYQSLIARYLISTREKLAVCDVTILLYYMDIFKLKIYFHILWFCDVTGRLLFVLDIYFLAYNMTICLLHN